MAQLEPKTGHNYGDDFAKNHVPTKVRVGSEDKFVPNVYASKWDDEAWLTINFPQNVTDEIETYSNGTVELVLGIFTHRYYGIDEENLEYEIEMSSRPPADSLTFNLDFPKGLEFYYQDTLLNDYNNGCRGSKNATYEEFLLKAHRPENVEGSYAIYWSKKDNKYQTGKFGHIYRPHLTDALGAEIYADISMAPNFKRMTVSVDGTWLDNATYPVIIDPVLGYDTQGSSSYGDAAEKYADVHTTDGTGGNVDTYHVYMESVQNNAEGVKMGIYPYAGGSSLVGAVLVEQVLIDPASTTGDNSTAGSGSALSASTDYAIVSAVEHGNNDIYYDSGSNTQVGNDGVTYANEILATGESGFDDPYTDVQSQWIVYSAGGPETIGCTVADGISLSDSNTNLMTLQAAIADGLSLSDSNENLKQLIAALIDGTIFADSTAIIKTVQGALADGIELSDASTVLAILQLALADGVELSDTPTVVKTFQGAIADGTTFSDSVTIGKLVQAALADGIELSDAVTAAVALQAALADGVKLTDTPTVLAILQAALGDGVTLSDTPTVLATLQGAIADGTVYSDSTTIGKLVQAALADGVTFSDSTTVVKTISGLVSDGVTLSESFSAFITLLAAVTDGTKFSDSVTGSTTGAIAAAIAEGLVLSDSTTGLATFQSAIAEGTVFSDTPSVYKLLSAAAQDGLTLSDSAAAGFILLAQLADGITLSDSGTVKATFSVTAQDGVEFADLVAVIAQLGAAVSDGITLSDSSREASTLVSGIMNVTFTAGQAEITFTVSKPSIDFTGEEPSITFTGTK